MYENTIAEIDGVTYAFNKSGQMITGWGMVDDLWYYCNGSGAVQYDWQYINGKWYYLDSYDGYMYTSTWYSTEYYLLPSGEMATGWAYIDGEWFYFLPNGVVKDGWLAYNGDWYYCTVGWMVRDSIWHKDGICYAFGNDGKMVKNSWFLFAESVNADAEWYYFDANGAGHDGWLLYGGHWYYCEDGKMAYNTTIEIGGKTAAFDQSGIWTGYVE